MKTVTVLLFLSLSLFKFIRVQSDCQFRFGVPGSDGFESSSRWEGNCLCGPKNQTFDNNDKKYCCAPKNKCVEIGNQTKWCPDGKLHELYQSCNEICGGEEFRCPSNPGKVIIHKLRGEVSLV